MRGGTEMEHLEKNPRVNSQYSTSATKEQVWTAPRRGVLDTVKPADVECTDESGRMHASERKVVRAKLEVSKD